MIRRQAFKLMAPSRYILIPIIPKNGLPQSEKKPYIGGLIDYPMYKYRHLLTATPAVESKPTQETIYQKKTEEEFSHAKLFFTSLIKFCPMDIILKIVSACEVYHRNFSKDDSDKTWQKSKLRNRIVSILSRTLNNNQRLQIIMQEFDKTKDQYLTLQFLKSHEVFFEINRASRHKELRFNHIQNIYNFNKSGSIVNQNLQFKSIDEQSQPLKPSEHFLFDDDQDMKQLTHKQQQESLYNKLIMRSTYKEEVQKFGNVVQQNKPEQQKNKKHYEKIVLVNNNTEPLQPEYGQRWIYVYDLPYDLLNSDIQKVLKYAGQFGTIVSHKAFSYKQLLDVNEQFFRGQIDVNNEQQQQAEKPKNLRRSIQQKLLARSYYSLNKQINMNKSYMLLQFKQYSDIITQQSRLFGILYQKLLFKLEYANYKRSLIIKGIPIGIDNVKLTTILNAKFIQKDLRGLILSPNTDKVIKNFNNHAILKFNSFWQTLKAIQCLSALKHNGLNFKLNHIYGGLKVLNNTFEQNFQDQEYISKSDKVNTRISQTLKQIVQNESKIQIDIAM